MTNLRKEEVAFYINKNDYKSRKILMLDLELWNARNQVKALEIEIAYLQKQLQDMKGENDGKSDS